MTKIAIVYHRIDFDGICSYAVIRDAIELNLSIAKQKFSITPIPWNRGDVLPELDGYDTVFVADICFPVPVMKKINDNARLIWIDHHATSIKEMEEAGLGRIGGLRRIGVGACELAWEQMNPGTVCPRTVALLSAYDVWNKERFDWEAETLPFQYGMRNRFGLDADKFVNEFYSFDDEVIGTICDEGRAVVRYIRQGGRNGVRNYGFDIMVGSVMKGLAILTDQGGSAPYEESAVERGAEVIVTLNRIGDDRYKISCYCPSGKPTVHIGKYLKEFYGGGGHEGAGGAVINTMEFVRIITEKQL